MGLIFHFSSSTTEKFSLIEGNGCSREETGKKITKGILHNRAWKIFNITKQCQFSSFVFCQQKKGILQYFPQILINLLQLNVH